MAVLEGRAPLEAVCALTRYARLMGASLGMTRMEAEGLPGLRLLRRSLESEAAARAVLFECTANFSPRIEDSSRGAACSCVLDMPGAERLFGPPAALADRLRTTLADGGFRASVAVSANFHAARLKAAATRGITVIAPEQEALALAKLPIEVLALAAVHPETLSVWGIRTLAEMAALPETEVVTRLGAQAADWRHLARGVLPHTFQPIEPDFTLREICEFENPVEQSDSLLFVGARMIDWLVARASARALALSSLIIHMELAGGRVYRRVIRPATPTAYRKFLLKLLQLEIAAHPPQAEVLRLTLTAEADQSSTMQLDLFAPQTPEPSRLDVTIARLKAIAGEDRVGSPVLEDSHRPGSFCMENFAGAANSAPASSTQSASAPPRSALRRMRPPVLIQMELREHKPVAFRDRERRYKVEAAYGPWRTSGCWWSADGWNAEEWDVLAETGGDSVACLLVRNRGLREGGRSLWQLEAFYV